MPKYYQYQIAGYYLYYTSHCIIECARSCKQQKIDRGRLGKILR